MPVPSTIADLTTSEATNSPADSETITATTRPSDYLRAHAAIIKTLEGVVNGKAGTAVENTWTAQQTPMNGALTFGAPTAWDCDVTGQVASLTTGGSDFTLSNPTNVLANTCYIIVVTQGATARVITWSANYLFPGGVDPVLTATAAAIDVFTFIGTSAGKMLCVGVAKGLA